MNLCLRQFDCRLSSSLWFSQTWPLRATWSTSRNLLIILRQHTLLFDFIYRCIYSIISLIHIDWGAAVKGFVYRRILQFVLCILACGTWVLSCRIPTASLCILRFVSLFPRAIQFLPVYGFDIILVICHWLILDGIVRWCTLVSTWSLSGGAAFTSAATGWHFNPVLVQKVFKHICVYVFHADFFLLMLFEKLGSRWSALPIFIRTLIRL